LRICDFRWIFSIHVNINSVDANIYVSLVSLIGVLAIGAHAGILCTHTCDKIRNEETYRGIKQLIQDQINESVLEGNIARMLDIKLKPIEEDIREIKHKLDRIEERD